MRFCKDALQSENPTQGGRDWVLVLLFTFFLCAGTFTPRRV